MPTTEEVVKEYLKFKGDPALALFQFAQELREKVSEIVIAEVAKAVAEIKQQDPQNAGFVEKITKKIVADLVKETRGDKGDPGPKGDSPIKGIHYFTQKEMSDFSKEISEDILKNKLIAGRDYPTPKEVEKIIKKQVSTIKLPKPNDGKTPLVGVDYFTKKDIAGIVSTVIQSLDAKAIKNKLESLQDNERLDVSAIKHIDEIIQKIVRMIPRRKTDIRIGELVGTGDGTTTVFTLPFVLAHPERGIILTVGGGLIFEKEDFTRVDTQITFITAPPSGAKIRVIAET